MSTTEDLMTADTVPASPVLGAKGAVRADRLYTEKELEDGIDEDHTSLEPDATDVSQSADDSPVEDEDVDMEPSLSETIAMIDLKDKTLDLNNERLVAAEAKAETLEVALESLKKENKKNIKKFEDTYASYKLKKDALADAIKDNEKALDEIGFFETNCKALREQVSVLKTKVKVQEEHLQSYAATLDSTQQELDDLYSSRKRQRDATVVLDSDGEPIDETPLPLPADKRATTTSTATPTKEESRKTRDAFFRNQALQRSATAMDFAGFKAMQNLFQFKMASGIHVMAPAVAAELGAAAIAGRSTHVKNEELHKDQARADKAYRKFQKRQKPNILETFNITGLRQQSNRNSRGYHSER